MISGWYSILSAKKKALHRLKYQEPLFSDLSNKKSHKVKLSRKGRDLVAKSSHLVEKVSQKVLESLFDRELNMFTSLLQRIQARA